MAAVTIAFIMTARGFTVFDTAIDRCGIVWGEHGIAGVQLPEKNEAATRSRMQRRFPDAQEASPPPEVRSAIDAMVALLQGESIDLSTVQLDLRQVPEFNRRVYEIARTIPAGATLTYGEIAIRLGDRTASRAVGQALGSNPFPIIVPCHRVLAAGGKSGGFSANGGVRTKFRLLSIEGVQVNGTMTLFDE